MKEKLGFWGVDRAEDLGFSAEFLKEAGLTWIVAGIPAQSGQPVGSSRKKTCRHCARSHAPWLGGIG